VLRLNAVHIGIWTLFFAFLYSTQFIGPRHEGQTLEFWRQACSDGGHKGCRYLMTLLGAPEGCQMLMMLLADQCNQGRGESCHELSLILTPLAQGKQGH
jgi:hypothetical protein